MLVKIDNECLLFVMFHFIFGIKNKSNLNQVTPLTNAEALDKHFDSND